MAGNPYTPPNLTPSGAPCLPPLDPELGADALSEAQHAECFTYLGYLVREGRDASADFCALADQNTRIFVYGADPMPLDDGEVIVNNIKNAIIAATDIQTKEPPTATLEPVESGEPPEYYWAGPQQAGLMLNLPTQCVTDWLDDHGQLHPPLPLDPDSAEQFMDSFEAMAAAGQVKEDWIVAVTDETVADVYQSVFDVLWARVQMDRRVRSNLLTTNIGGWTFWVYEWDDDKQVPIVRPMSVWQCYCDPVVEDIADAQYFVYDVILDASEAKAMYPKLALQIDEYAHTGAPRVVDGYTHFGENFQRNFQRPVIELRVGTIRNQPRRLTIQEAIAGGHVEQREIPAAIPNDEFQMPSAGLPDPASDEFLEMEGLPSTGDLHAEQETPATSQSSPATRQSGSTAAGAGPGDDPEQLAGRQRGSDSAPGADQESAGETAEPGESGADGIGRDDGQRGQDGDADADADAVGAVGAQGAQSLRAGDPSAAGAGAAVRAAATETRLFLAGTDIDVTPQALTPEALTPEADETGSAGSVCYHDAWPTRLVLRQMTAIAGRIVDDRECEHWDMPILHNVNSPIPGKPFGMGEPFDLKRIQTAGNRVVTSMVDYIEYFRAPGRVIPRSVYEQLPEEIRDHYIDPSTTLVMEDEMYSRLNGKAETITPPPPMPEGLLQILPILKNIHDGLSGVSEVLQGRAQPQVKSGKAIELLQEASSSNIGFKSQRTGDLVYRLSRLLQFNIVWRMSASDIGRIVRRYRGHVLEAIHRRGRNMEWESKVIVTSGNGQIKSQRQQEARVNYQTGLIDEETAQEQLNIDSRLVRQRRQASAQMMPGAQAIAAGASPSGAAAAAPAGAVAPPMR